MSWRVEMYYSNRKLCWEWRSRVEKESWGSWMQVENGCSESRFKVQIESGGWECWLRVQFESGGWEYKLRVQFERAVWEWRLRVQLKSGIWEGRLWCCIAITIQIQYKYRRKQAGSVVSGTNGFINFWIRFFDTRRETQFLLC